MTMKWVFMGVFILTAVVFAFWTPDMSASDLDKRYAKPSMEVLEVDGLNIHYKDTGPKIAPVLLLLHGFGSSLQTWDDWAAQLDKHYRVIRLDLPGFGLTGPSPLNDYSEAKDLATLTHFVDKLGIAELSVIGHSMGGKMAWMFAADQGPRVKALVLMAPDGYPQAEDIGSRPYAMPAVMGLMKFFLPKYLVRKSLEPAFFNAAALDERLVERYHDMLRAPGVRGAILERGQQTIYTDPVTRLKKITAPTLLLWGQDDLMIPSSNAQSYAGVLADAQTVLLPHLGHLLQEEQSHLGLAQVTQFLSKNLQAVK